MWFPYHFQKLLTFLSIIVTVALARSGRFMIQVHMDDDENDQNCPDLVTPSNEFFAPRCCGRETFQYWHLQEYFDNCAIPPDNEALSLADCHWKLIQCLVANGLREQLFSPTHFTMFMAAALCKGRKSDLTNALRKRMEEEEERRGRRRIVIGEGKSEAEDLNTFKNMWAIYFDLEEEVCIEEIKKATKQWDPWTTIAWAPMYTCKNVSYPRLGRCKVPEVVVESCINSMAKKYTLANSNSNRHCLYASCKLIEGGLVTEADLSHRSPDFEGIVGKILPKFWSKTAKNTVLGRLGNSATIVGPNGKSAMTMTMREGVAATIDVSRREAEVDVDAKNIQDEVKHICKAAVTVQKLMKAIDEAQYGEGACV